MNKKSWIKDNSLLKEASSNISFQKEIVNLINKSRYFISEVDCPRIGPSYVKVLYNDNKLADFRLDKDSNKRSYAIGELIPSTVGDGEDTFEIIDVSIGWDDDFLYIYKNESRCLDKLDREQKIRYYTLKLLYEKNNIKGFSVPEELNNWYCAQWGTWKFDASCIEYVKACLAALEEACRIVESN